MDLTPLGVGNAALHRLPLLRDKGGAICVGEFEHVLPFQPKRFFLVFDVHAAQVRGAHAHRRCEQFLVCVKGSVLCRVDDGRAQVDVPLTEPNVGLYVPAGIWGQQSMHSPDAVLLVFASHAFDEADYIRSYPQFQRWIDAPHESTPR